MMSSSKQAKLYDENKFQKIPKYNIVSLVLVFIIKMSSDS